VAILTIHYYNYLNGQLPDYPIIKGAPIDLITVGELTSSSGSDLTGHSVCPSNGVIEVTNSVIVIIGSGDSCELTCLAPLCCTYGNGWDGQLRLVYL